ncbi:hypothetical protein [Ferruginibacter profundus]
MISQHNAMQSLNEALVPGPGMIDGRTESDWLWFLAEFAGSINFYDQNNLIRGNWKPFLLKDPVFLLAHISKTPYSYYYTLYKETCLKIERPVFAERSTALKFKIIEQFFVRFNEVLEQVACWTHFMQLTGEEYELRWYVTGLVKTSFSPYYWAFKALRERLLFVTGQREIYSQPVVSEYFDNALWLQHRGNGTFKDVLGFDKDLKFANDDISADKCYDVLQVAGNNLFNFFNTIIKHSSGDFFKQANKPGAFPDTVLLRTFVNLLKNQQHQLNGIAKKHLDFYYRDILKQHEWPAQPDKAFICATLMNPGAVLNLDAGTAFDAGLDGNKDPVVFNSTGNVCINPAGIVSVTTLSVAADANNKEKGEQLVLTPVADTTTLQYTANGQLKSWETFGGSTSTGSRVVSTGMALASPMLYLTEGNRKVTIKFVLSPLSDEKLENFTALLKASAMYLSTASGWLRLSGKQLEIYSISISSLNYAVVINICLDHQQPAIQAFSVNPDGYNCLWPLFKIVFDQIPGTGIAPLIETIDIDVDVNCISNFLLYNDSGALATKTPYPAFGSTPMRNSNFIIGHSEIFSKPFNSFTLKLNWDNLPENFQAYYHSYNKYLYVKYPQPLAPVVSEKSPDEQNKNAGGGKNFWQKLLAALLWIITAPWKLLVFLYGVIKKIFTKIIQEIEAEMSGCLPFNNSVFITNFQLLQDTRWQAFAMKSPEEYAVLDSPCQQKDISGIQVSPSRLPNSCIPGSCVPADSNGQFLFRVKNPIAPFGCELAAASYFAITPDAMPAFTPDPSIQLSPLSFADASTSGFMKMTLTGPDLGFGSSVYAQVVANIALLNGLAIIKAANDNSKPDLIPQANLPFVPNLRTLVGGYKASYSYKLASKSGSYPLQVFLYSPFNTYLTYNNAQKLPAGIPVQCIPFFPSFNYRGALFIELANLVTGNTLNLYFQMTRRLGIYATGKKIFYCYLSVKGWRPLTLLRDGTNNFSCSGIIEFDIPADIDSYSPLMKGNNYWISIAVKNEPSLYSETVYLNTNGIEVIRSGTSYLTDQQAPYIKANTIVKPFYPVPSIATITQPFDSFGGKAAENAVSMNARVSNRIKTKDRAITPGDYFSIINRKFNYIFYAKIYTPRRDKIIVLLVKRAAGYFAPNAFLPFVTECEEIEIKDYLAAKASPFARPGTANFEPEYVKVTITVVLKKNYQKALVEQDIDMALNIYLSPWIDSDQKQATIDQGISDSGVADCIREVEGVEAVSEVRFTTWIFDKNSKAKKGMQKDETVIAPSSPAHLFVPSLQNNIIWKIAV